MAACRSARPRRSFVWEETEHDGLLPTRVPVRAMRSGATSNGLASISLFGAAGFTVRARTAMSVRSVRVSANYFETLGIRPDHRTHVRARRRRARQSSRRDPVHALWQSGSADGATRSGRRCDPAGSRSRSSASCRRRRFRVAGQPRDRDARSGISTVVVPISRRRNWRAARLRTFSASSRAWRRVSIYATRPIG
jgi:hypothetical protein